MTGLSYTVIARAHLPLKTCVQPSARLQEARKKVEWNVTIKSKRNKAWDEYITSTLIYT